MSRGTMQPVMNGLQGNDESLEWRPGPGAVRHDVIWSGRVARSVCISLLALVAVLFVTWIPTASADIVVPPRPVRPAWDQEPRPEPEPPPEKPLERAAMIGFGLGALALAFVVARRRERRSRAEAHAGYGAACHASASKIS